jgi:orotidine-5'-phosphate decarboxylase
MNPKERLIFALDVDHFDEARKLVQELREHVGMFKVGKQLFTHCGPKIVDFIKMKGSRAFLDLKFHDIPNTVAKAAVEAAKLSVDLLNVHASGGFEMMRAAREALNETATTLGRERPRIIGVTVLTSIDDGTLGRMGITLPVAELTKNLALLAAEAGLDGVVAGGPEIGMIRGLCGPDFLIITPGVRLTEAKKDDQKRTIGPAEAVARGATYIVLGRAVRDSEDPPALLENICAEIASALSHRDR